MLLEALTASVRQNDASSDTALKRLSNFARTGDERLLVERLEAEKALAKSDFGAAFDVFRRLAAGDRRGLIFPAAR